MLKFKIWIYFLLVLILANFIYAATIHGTVYDFSLEKISNAIVEIDTLPKQFLVTQNGSYSFNVPNGDYTIKAQIKQKNKLLASVEENITIKQDGSYVLDLILFPDIKEGIEDDDIEDIDDIGINGDIIKADKNSVLIRSTLAGSAVLLILGIILVGLYHFKKRRKQKEEKIEIEKKESQKEETYDASLDKVLGIINAEGGRTTQKEIRKQIPMSEAKISLMLAELEHKNIIEKIKKGRGNIIILKKK